MDEQIAGIITSAISNNILPGCTIGYIKNNKLTVLPFGRLTYDQDSSFVTKDTIYDVASITKVIPTSTLVLQLIDEGILHVSDKVIKYVPEITSKYREKLTILHLLTHTVSFSFRLSSVKTNSADELLEKLFKTEYTNKPGSSFHYSNGASILLGIVIERVTNTTLDELAKNRFFNPLGMKRTMFGSRAIDKRNIAPTEIDTNRGTVHGTVHDESAAILEKKRVVGSAGLFSTAEDLLSFLNMLLGDGTIKRKRFFSKHMVTQMYTNQLDLVGVSTGLGWELNQPRFMGQNCAGTTFGKTGFTGCMVVCDVAKQVGLVMLSNEIFPQRKANKLRINRIRSQLADIVFD